MSNETNYVEELKKNGLISLASPYPDEVLAKWNRLLDPLLDQRQKGARSYVNATELMSLGILEEIFTPAMRSTVRTIMQDAVIYHCHVYEIEANQTVSHIHQGSNLGWHRDEECMPDYEPGKLHHLSLFIYLTQVNEENGPFEFAPQSPVRAARSGMPTLKVLGKPGTTFFWNRAYRHRACPNLSNQRRRLIKLSIQNNNLDNDRINLPEFAPVREQFSNTDPYLAFLFGKFHDGKGAEQLPAVKEDNSLRIVPFASNANLTVSTMGLLKMNYIKPIYNRVKEKLTGVRPE